MADHENICEATSGHGSSSLTAVRVDTYNAELRDDDGFIGDRASGRAFRALLDDARDRVSQQADDPLGKVQTDNIGKQTLDQILRDGDAEAAGVVLGTIENFAQEFASVWMA